MNPSQFLRHVDAQQQSTFLHIAKKDLRRLKREKVQRGALKMEFVIRQLERKIEDHNSHYHHTSPYFITTSRRK